MRLALALPYADGSMAPEQLRETVRAADRLGYHSLWVAEAWSLDAFQVLATIAADTEQIGLATGIANVYSRTPALLGQSIATLDLLSSGRAILGLGASGPQVIEGWHGLPYDRPLERTREAIDIVRTILRRDRLVHDGEIWQLDLGLKLINHPVRDRVPIVVAALGPRNVALTAELADGWLPVLWSPEKANELWGNALERGGARRPDTLGRLEVMPSVTVAVTDEDATARLLAKAGLALYLGGMGSRDKNFYNDVACRLGHQAEAREVQDLYLSGDRKAAAARVSDELVDELCIIGDEGRVKERMSQFAESGVHVMVVSLATVDHAERMGMLEALTRLV